jgi:hypothetical protein
VTKAKRTDASNFFHFFLWLAFYFKTNKFCALILSNSTQSFITLFDDVISLHLTPGFIICRTNLNFHQKRFNWILKRRKCALTLPISNFKLIFVLNWKIYRCIIIELREDGARKKEENKQTSKLKNLFIKMCCFLLLSFLISSYFHSLIQLCVLGLFINLP